MVREKRRIAFFGGTFDPVHNGHLAMAQAASEQLRLNRVYLVPAGQNPLKTDGPIASTPDRLEMLRTAIEPFWNFGIWEGELGREGLSYTYHSVKHIENVYPNAHLFWIIGSDQMELLPHWYEIEKLVRRIHFILVKRPGYDLVWPSIPGLTVYPVDNPPHETSSTAIRDLCRAGKSIKGMVPDAVEAYISGRGLYR